MASKKGRIRTISVRFTATLTDFEKQLNKAQKQLNKAAKEMKKAGDFLTKNVTAPIIAIGTALATMTLSSAKAADDLMDLSAITGISTDRLQELSFAGQILGTDLETITDAQTRLTRAMYDAHKGNKEAVQAFQMLGVQIYDTEGNFRSVNDVFFDVIDALGKMKDPTMADAIAMELMGRSARDLNPLIQAGSERIKELSDKARELGLVVSEENLASLAELNDEFDTLKFMAKAAGSEIAVKLAPILKDVISTITEKLPDVRDRIKEIIDKFKELTPEQQNFILTALGIAVALGPVLLGLAALVKAIAWVVGAFKVLAPVLTFIASPIGLIILAVAALVAAFIYLWNTNEGFREFIKTAWEKIKEWVITAVNKVVEWVEKFKEAVIKAWEKIKEWFGNVTGWIGEKADAFGKFFVNIWDKIKEGIAKAVDFVKEKIDAFKNFVDGVIDKIKDVLKWIGIYNDKKVEEKAIVEGNFVGGTSGGGGGLGGGGAFIDIPEMGKGGILTSPRLVIAGDTPEAIIPLDRLEMAKPVNVIQVILDGRVIDEYVDNSMGNKLAGMAGVW